MTGHFHCIMCITRKKICQLLSNLYAQYNFLMESGVLTDKDRDFFQRVSPDMDDVMLEPAKAKDDAIILEFKIFDPKKEKDLEDTVRRAHEQIERKRYAAALLEKGISADRIRAYGFALGGKNVLIG